MSLYNELVEIAAALEVPEGFRADANGDVIVVWPQHSAHWQLISDIAFRIRLEAPSLRIESNVRIGGTGVNYKAPDISIFHTKCRTACRTGADLHRGRIATQPRDRLRGQDAHLRSGTSPRVFDR